MTTQDVYGIPEIDQEARTLAKRKEIAQQLFLKNSQPLQTNTMAGGYVVPIAASQGLGQIANALVAKYQENKADTDQAALATKAQQRIAEEMAKYQLMKSGTPAIPGQTTVADTSQEGTGSFDMSGGAGPATTTVGGTPAVPGDPQAAVRNAIMSTIPQLQRMGTLDLAQLNRKEDRADTQDFKATEAALARQAKAEEAELARKQRQSELELRLADAATAREDRAALARELATSRAESAKALKELGRGIARAGGKAPVGYRFSADGETLEPIPGGPKDNSGGKPLPTQAVKMQQAELDAIGTSSGINADLGGVAAQLENGTLKLGPIRNLANQVRNKVGESTIESRNLGSFQNTLEKLRNDSLRLNKGVQTEGDAQRAWNELLANINDPDVVKQRIGEIQEINKRAVDLRKANVENIRRNYGAGEIDYTPYEGVPGATNLPGRQPAAPARRASDQPGAVLRFDAAGNPI